MEQLKRKRTSMRTAFTRAFNSWNASFTASDMPTDEATVAIQLLEEKIADLNQNFEQIMEKMYANPDVTDIEIDKELEDADEYRKKFLAAKLRHDNRMDSRIQVTSGNTATVAQSDAKKSFKLPRIELAKFSGNVREWLQFWSVFKKIHEDVNIENEDKFQYLLQAMVPDSRSAELVKSYPPTGENYDKVIVSLKNRFGRDDLQIEVYVRELLQLVLQNAMKPSREIQLSTLYDKIESYLRALDTLGVTTDKCAAMLYPLVESSLPEELLRVWQRSNLAKDMTVNNVSENSTAQPTDRLTQLIKFLESEVQNELRISMAVDGFGLKATGSSESEKTRRNNSHPESRNTSSARGLLITNQKESLCLFCDKKGHESVNCFGAKRIGLKERQEAAKRKRACFKCLKIGHCAKDCHVNVKCEKCARRHVVLMRPEGDEKKIDKAEKKISNAESAKQNSDSGVVVERSCTGISRMVGCSYACANDNPHVFMQTLRVKLFSDNREIRVRALIDTGSQNSYIIKRAVAQVNYKPIAEQEIVHLLFSGEKTDTIRHKKYLVRLANLDGSFKCNFATLDQDVICESIPCIRKGVWCEELQRLNIKLSDMDSPEESVAVLIGVDVAGNLFTGRRHKLDCGLIAIETLLGWTMMGKVPGRENRENLAITAINMFVKCENIKDLWSLDVLGIKDPVEHKTQGERDKEMEENFLKTVNLTHEGRYEVRLPWKESHPALNDNKQMAVRRLQATLKKVDNMELFQNYDAVFKEWLAEGIVELVPDGEEESWGHYLPHRPVIKENSTTAIRPVFDASARDGQFPALNECLQKGPNLIEYIASVLLRFREGKIGVVSDIRKAFLQICIHPKDRDFLRYLWVNEKGDIIVLRHCRVVFGVCSSPFILGAIIKLHLNGILNSLSSNSDLDSRKENIYKLSQSFYVDNCVTSVNSVESLNKFVCDAKTAMVSAGFDLRGWEYTNDGDSENQTGVLGIMWNKSTDTLFLTPFNTEKIDLVRVTKRSILSAAHRVFDPLGFVCPVTLDPRILLQEAWTTNVSWDDEVNKEIKQRFIKWIEDLKDLPKIQVPRCMIGETNGIKNISLHTFCDASKYAYACVTFIRIEKPSEISVFFVQAKTRVAPTKGTGKTRVSIPRLELLAATIGARLTARIVEACTFENFDVYYWSDSSTVLAWIRRKSNWSTFVANRVKEIHELSSCEQWRHVPGHLNPADLPSRGCTVSHALASKWWEGPEWLRLEKENWPNQPLMIDENAVETELRKGKLPVQTQSPSLICGVENSINERGSRFFARFSSFIKTVRIVAWLRRFFFNCKNSRNTCKQDNLTVSEIDSSEIILIKMIQTENFEDVNDERIKQFSPFKDENGLLRMKSKVLFRDDTFNFRCPIILPDKNYIVDLIIKEKHNKLNHAGVTVTLSTLREKFWILGGRKTIRSVIRKCIECRRYDAKPCSTDVAPLPFNRVRDAAIFEVIGVDFAGPIYLRGGGKAWICLFTCAVYRAVHLELVSSLSIASFLMALKRHIARRGRPSIIYSDNGTNFVGLNNALKNINFKKVASIMSLERIEWRFNPPSAPWWGGFWERLIGIVKRLLRRTLKKTCLNYEEMVTILTDCEAVMNCRPISFVSDNKDELVPLTPSMFLQEVKEIGTLDLDKVERTIVNKRYQYRQKIKEELKRRFRNEYLGALAQQRIKYNKLDYNIKVGDIVLIGSDNTKRLDWPLARIKELIAGKDGNIRVVRLTTRTGEVTRPIQRIYPLEINYSSCNNDEERTGSSEEIAEPTRIVKQIITRSGRTSRIPDRLAY